MTETRHPRHTLYICYFGLKQPLVQTQVIPYLLEIAKLGTLVSLLTFEPELNANWTVDEIRAMQRQMSDKGIKWHSLPYHKRPSGPATAFDIFNGARVIRQLICDENVDVLHGRVHVATLMGAIARKLSRQKPKLIFDIRGFFPEEYTDAGVWTVGGRFFRSAKRVERWLLSEADGFVVLTEKAREILFTGSRESGCDNADRPVEVIPCCVDLRKRFAGSGESRRMAMRDKLGIGDRFVITHVGALGGLYLTDEIVDLFVAAREIEPRTFALFLTQTDSSELVAKMRAKGFSENNLFVATVDPSDVPDYLAASDAGLSFVKATYATTSRSPTKIPEYLAAGLPIIANSGVGDVDALIDGQGVGVLVGRFDHDAYTDAVRRLLALGDIAERCRQAAVNGFDLETVGGPRYRRLYERLFCNPGD